MECLFGNYDYAVRTPDGKQLIIPRNESTAFLSKHLRAYKGTGEYQGNKVGRMMRNMVFSGEGLVTDPGNTNSIILSEEDSEIFKGLLAEANKIEITDIQGDHLMPGDNETVQAVEKQLSEANRLNNELNTRLKSMDEAKVKERYDALEAQIKAQATDLLEANKKFQASEVALAEATKKQQASEAAKAEIEKSLATVTSQLQQIEAEKKSTNRISTLVDKGVEKASAETLVAKFANLNDEQFETIVQTQAELVVAKKAAVVTPPAKPEGKVGGAGSADAADLTALTDAEDVPDPALVVKPEGQTEETIAALSNYFAEMLNGATGEAQS
jgi:hypothetical protein